MQPVEQERPCIHVTLLPQVDANLYRWVQIGAEEEGVPCRKVEIEGNDEVANAFAASQSSKFNIGVAVGSTQVVLHETHMPPNTPVLAFEINNNLEWLARLIGSNAARMIIRKPFRFDDEVDERATEPVTLPKANVSPPPSPNYSPPLQEPEPPTSNDLDPAQLTALVTAIVRKLLERGVQ